MYGTFMHMKSSKNIWKGNRVWTQAMSLRPILGTWSLILQERKLFAVPAVYGKSSPRMQPVSAGARALLPPAHLQCHRFMCKSGNFLQEVGNLSW